jgi:hypothetical protein
MSDMLLEDEVLDAAQTAQALASGSVSYRKPDGLILSTGNLYFTSRDGSTACVWRMAQSAIPGQELLLYSEPDARFGDIVYAQVGGVWWGYFFATKSGVDTIKRVPLTGGAATTLTTVTNVDIGNSRRNLVTDGVHLYWQDVSAVRKMPIGGGAITELDPATPNTPTAGISLRNGNIIYASVADIRYVPTGGAVTTPMARTITTGSSRVTALFTVANGVYWGENDGAVRLRVGSTTTTLQPATGLVPTSIATNGYTAGGALVWTECGSSTCRMHFRFPSGNWVTPIADDALGAAVTSSGNVFWGDADGVHRQVF